MSFAAKNGLANRLVERLIAGFDIRYGSLHRNVAGAIEQFFLQPVQLCDALAKFVVWFMSHGWKYAHKKGR